jgi:hypothetical protein
MAKNYAEEESLERIYRRLKGQSDPDPVEELQGLLNFFVPLYMRPQTSAPTGTALDYLGGVLYAEDGALKWYGSSGTITTLAGS